eukprot:scaffold21985_cov34-Attheya_sp.AAC.1
MLPYSQPVRRSPAVGPWSSSQNQKAEKEPLCFSTSNCRKPQFSGYFFKMMRNCFNKKLLPLITFGTGFYIHGMWDIPVLTTSNITGISKGIIYANATATGTPAPAPEYKDQANDRNHDHTTTEPPQSEHFLDSCGCPSSCSFWNLMDKNASMGFLCEERIAFLQGRHKVPRLDACTGAADNGYCTLSCHPKVCAPFTPEPFPPSPISHSMMKMSTKTIHYLLDTRTEGQYHNLYDGIKCPDEDRPAPLSTLSQPGQLDFATHVTTNLKILVMGDSVGATQIGQDFMEAATFNVTNADMTHIQAPGGRPYPNNHVSALPTQGGGTAMVYRANAGMLSKKLLRDAPLGVSAHHVRGLQRHLHITTGSSSIDAMVLQIPAGWIGLEQQIKNAVTQETLAESVRWAGEIFGAKTTFVGQPELKTPHLYIKTVS